MRNNFKDVFGLAFVFVEKDGKELYRAGKEDPPKDYWDGSLRPAKDVKKW